MVASNMASCGWMLVVFGFFVVFSLCDGKKKVTKEVGITR